ncbi:MULTISPECIES: tripartite tricarboxylate transporter TctB family protein [unclassified Paenibacillus]|uniref:tripartite tricarboxylate transporter TctB family protein n=1 Tax=unclassified Paenibacillus TaxID=185978 RepID=UPI001AE46FC7|nr:MULTISPECIES: tripartite tricarboxylate transporter TctB family protein [unclassified Paenibacillus]MBP1154903.1 magnesium-transporting ATPase (P-type) [Paenibacillus sp. PvP091]MBP1169713.1 magnesium-transporting ATPase (P-type) [Paenibacillus sp. PvR098]MBP2440741.1 magnesium-transporting ATPase (P-type) [Paenibacillus sp. PvP052]
MKIAGLWVGLFFFIFSLVMLWQSLTLDYTMPFGPGPGFMPFWVNIIFLVLSLLFIWESVQKNPIVLSQIIPKGRGLTNNIAILLSIIVFMIIVNYTGFIVAGSIMLFILFSRNYKWYLGLGLSVMISGLVFIVFKTLLDVPLPVNTFGW